MSAPRRPRRGPDPDELYVGYLPKAPPGIARFVRRVVWLLAAVVVGAAILLAVLQSPFDPGFFELGTQRTLVGRVAEQPYPTLIVEAPGARSVEADSGQTHLLLVDPGKHGAQERVRGLDGAPVELTGTLAARPDLAILELASEPRRLPAPIEPSEGGSAPGPRTTLRGEIVDSKCFAGVMKPGRGKVHRSCAALCIAGGIPPAFVTSAGDGGVEIHLLVDAEGAPVGERILPWVGEPVELEGAIETRGGLSLLRADLETLRRLGSRSSPSGG